MEFDKVWLPCKFIEIYMAAYSFNDQEMVGVISSESKFGICQECIWKGYSFTIGKQFISFDLKIRKRG